MSELLSSQERRVAAVLVLRGPGPVPLGDIASFIWPASVAIKNYEASIRTVVLRLRHRMGIDSIKTYTRIGFQLVPKAVPRWAMDQIEAEVQYIQLSAGDNPRPSVVVATARRAYNTRSVHPSKLLSAGKERSRRGSWPCLQTPEGCNCRCHLISSRTRGIRKPNSRDWKPDHDRVIIETWTATYWLPEVVEVYNRVYPNRPRSMPSIAHRLTYLGHSMRDGRYTVHEIAHKLGVTRNTVWAWAMNGTIDLTSHWVGRWYTALISDVEKMIRDHPGLVDPSIIKDPALKRSALLVARAGNRNGGMGEPPPRFPKGDGPTATRDRLAASRP